MPKKKNDKIDASKIADCLRAYLLPECYMAPSDIREMRRELRFRNLLVGEAVKMKNKISGVLLHDDQQSICWSDMPSNLFRGQPSFLPKLNLAQCTGTKVQPMQIRQMDVWLQACRLSPVLPDDKKSKHPLANREQTKRSKVRMILLRRIETSLSLN